jgi:hypothetical protein
MTTSYLLTCRTVVQTILRVAPQQSSYVHLTHEHKKKVCD